jgi:hypothetical protein
MCLMIPIYVDGISNALSQPVEGMVCIQYNSQNIDIETMLKTVYIVST